MAAENTTTAPMPPTHDDGGVAPMERETTPMLPSPHVADTVASHIVHRHGVAEEQNGRFRRTMEDGHVVEGALYGNPDMALYCVFDGHGGRQAADFAGEHFKKHVWDAVSAPDAALLDAEFMKKALEAAYSRTDAGLKEANILYAGATAAVCLLVKVDGRRMLYSANAGDARAVLWRGSSALRLTYDHKGTDVEEEIRIRGAGGFVSNGRVNGILAVTRALGDHMMKEFVTSEPYFSAVELTDADRFLIVACDGLWDVVEDEVACKLIDGVESALDASQVLVTDALELGSTDNITAVVVQLQPIEHKPNIDVNAIHSSPVHHATHGANAVVYTPPPPPPATPVDVPPTPDAAAATSKEGDAEPMVTTTGDHAVSAPVSADDAPVASFAEGSADPATCPPEKVCHTGGPTAHSAACCAADAPCSASAHDRSAHGGGTELHN